MAIGIGVDIGGTFTDLLMIDDVSGEVMVGKVLTTPGDPSLGVEICMRYVKAGRLKALAVTGSKRNEAAPDVPAMAEAYSGFEVTVWQGIGAPAATPRTIIDKLHAGLFKAMVMPDVRERLLQLGAEPSCTTPEEFTAHVAKERQKWINVVKKAGLAPQ